MTDHRLTQQADTLVLVPTEMERKAILSSWSPAESESVVCVCGLGVVAASVNSVCAIQQHRPRRVVLAGIAGLFGGETHRLGDAAFFDSVAIDGVGVGQGNDFLSPSQLGWDDPQWGGVPNQIQLERLHHNAAQRETLDQPGGESLNDSLGVQPNALLLTVCSATANPSEARWRSERFPNALAEDMEGYAVALACKTMGLPLSIVRGFSNVVGERDKANWEIRDALQSVSVALQNTIESDQ